MPKKKSKKVKKNGKGVGGKADVHARTKKVKEIKVY